MRRRRGFSLMEVFVCLGLLAILAGLTPLLMPTAPTRAGLRAAAETVAQALRAAQSRAILRQTPVAFAIPTQGGQKGYSRHFYFLEGFSSPRISEVTSLEEYRQTMLACPSWTYGGATFSSDSSGAGNKVLDLAKWSPPNPKDYLLIFLPTGQVISNGLPKVNNAFHVVLGQNMALQGQGGGSGPPAFVLQGASQVCTISVSNTGQVVVESGLTGTTALGAAGSSSDSPAPPPSLSPAPQQNPSITDIAVGPSSKDMTLPPNVQAMLQRDEFLTLTVKAKSPEGAPLFCSWTCSGGTFSHPGEKPMVWDNAEQVWVSVWQWEPGPDETAMDYTADCKVRDGWNHKAPATVNSQIKLQVQPRKPRVLAVANDANGPVLCSAYIDGTGQRTLTSSSSLKDYNSSISPDGTKIASLGKKGGQDIIVIRDMDGGILREISGIGLLDAQSPPCWSPDGAELLYVADGDIQICNVDGSNRRNLTHSPEADGLAIYNNTFNGTADPACLDDAVWSPDGKSFVYHKGAPGGQNILTLLTKDGKTSTPLSPAGTWRNVSFSPNGDKIVYDDNFGGQGLFMVDSDGKNRRRVGASSYDYNPRFSPDGTQICYTVDLLGDLMVTKTADPQNPSLVAINAGSASENRAFAPVWADDETISYLRGNGGWSARIMTVPVKGGKPDLILPVTALKGGNNIHIAGWTK